jgi:carboxyl-terminal processing protease
MSEQSSWRPRGLAWLPNLLLAGCASGPLCGEGALDAEMRSCVFETAWEAASTDYPFFELKDIDWAEIRSQYRAQLDQAETEQEFYELIARMIAELRDGHSRFDFIGASWGASVHAIEFVAIEGRYYVARVDETSQAWALGVRPGAELLSVDGEAVADRYARVRDQIGAANERWRQYIFTLAYLSAGEASEAQLELAAPGEAAEILAVPRTAEASSEASPSTSGPSVEGRLLDDRYGYIRIHTFEDEGVAEFDALIDEFADAPGLILDIRGNDGGSTSPMYDMAGRLFDEKVEVFRWHKRRTKVRSFKPRGDLIYTGPVVLLVDEAVFSTANAFAEGLQFTERATLVGRRTSGGTGVPEYDELLTPDARLRLSIYYHELVDGTQSEVSGVTPEVEVAWTPERLAAGVAQRPGDPDTDLDLAEALTILDEASGGETSTPHGCGCATPDTGGGAGAAGLSPALMVPAWWALRSRRRRRDRLRAASGERQRRAPGPGAGAPRSSR